LKNHNGEGYSTHYIVDHCIPRKGGGVLRERIACRKMPVNILASLSYKTRKLWIETQQPQIYC